MKEECGRLLFRLHSFRSHTFPIPGQVRGLGLREGEVQGRGVVGYVSRNRIVSRPIHVIADCFVRVIYQLDYLPLHPFVHSLAYSFVHLFIHFVPQ